MKHPKFRLWLICGSLGLAFAAYLLLDQAPFLSVIFLLIIIGTWLAKPKYDFSQAGKINEQQKTGFDKIYKDNGIFSYTETGFTISIDPKPTSIQWDEIDTLLAYKKDLLTTDEICLDMHWSGRMIRISESTNGWYQFLERLPRNFPGIKQGWDFDIIHPAFATNLTLLFDRKGRSMEQMLKEEYKD